MKMLPCAFLLVAGLDPAPCFQTSSPMNRRRRSSITDCVALTDDVLVANFQEVVTVLQETLDYAPVFLCLGVSPENGAVTS